MLSQFGIFEVADDEVGPTKDALAAEGGFFLVDPLKEGVEIPERIIGALRELRAL